mmetsp:Transcript_98724/g.283693  ORF Transcript_98724/g.283693 Transcript_98724/m.283693 type:complete len:275 (-) Transcript_98724:34-858(-)|eukprot:CAMPEP_0177195328 /NCGR_PEP_ID=MMETSP0367-20130122/23459_1 /TAXON_ID=447022 ORGANISM="Scrippsiella hangoei-like, Strain SHHI-4" /NCGR_SAMPLE_ID=MMETSP0367 /ASSEMBLY_ACC=CAM_ASM_000362 /LENGTH=274 /DNA_ID=CAMNT_0018643357 /DNA_START=68 /DNA_END=892 /DNA_ORIENTATION=+
MAAEEAAADSPSGAVEVRVRTLDGTLIPVRLEEGSLARNLKSHLQAELGLPFSQLHLLTSDGRLLENGDEVVPRGVAMVARLREEPLELTLVRSNPNVVEQFVRLIGLERATDLTSSGTTTLHRAAANNNKEVFFELFEMSEMQPLITHKDFLGTSLLHVACARADSEVVSAILRHPGFSSEPASVVARAKSGRTALHFAGGRGSADICAVLLEHPALGGEGRLELLQARTEVGESAADLACIAGFEELAEWLQGQEQEQLRAGLGPMGGGVPR